MIGSPIRAPSATTIALATTPSEDETVDAGVIAIGDQRRAGQAPAGPQSHLRRQLIPDEADHPGSGQHPQMREVLRVNQTLDRLVQRETGRNKDRKHDRQARELLAAEAAQEERDPQRHRRQRIAEVVNQIGEQGDRVRQHEDHHLHHRRRSQHTEAERDGLHASTRAHDRTIDQPVRVTVLAVLPMLVFMLMLAQLDGL
jgi:uncharacterized protein involved in exopolysaccharide biosynthesis